MNNRILHDSDLDRKQEVENTFYKEVMMWLLLAFSVAAVGTYFIGPLIPPSMMMPLYLVLLVSMILAGFTKKMVQLSGFFTVLFSLGLGIILYPTLNFYVATGSGDIVLMALAGTAVAFGGAAILGWNSKVSLESFAPMLTAMIFGVIAISLLNVFFFHLPWLQMVIAWGALIIFTIYAFIDIQRVKNRTGNMPASWYALNVFLDIYNIFVSLLQIIGGSNRN